MNRVEKSDIKKQIFRVKLLNIEQNFLFFKNYLLSYINCKMTFKGNFVVMNDLNSALVDYTKIIREEKLLMNLLIKYSNKIDYSEADYLLTVLDEINEKTMIDFFDYFDDIEVGCELKTDYRATRKGNKVISIADTDEYRKMFVSLLLKDKDIKSFLDYPDEFWKSISGKVQYTNIEDEDIWGIDYDIDDGSIVSIIIPNVINLDTALTNIEIFEEAYSKYIDSKEQESRTTEFEDVYLSNKTKTFFKKYE